ncbi:MAG: fibronectin type III domain-containing protein [Candidatus Moraniibacteriota bacterium]|nr:MAG: fibronectin type III domain-containing protein [Candidatus Moranbacteria bacterium]
MRRKVFLSSMGVLMSFFLVQEATASPSISSVSGTWNHKSTITVSGLGFGTKATVAPIVWDDASGSNILNNWSGAWPTSAAGSSQMNYYLPMRGVALPHNNITKYIAGCISGGGADTGNNADLFKTISNVQFPSYMYVSWYHRADPAWVFTGSEHNYKLFDWSIGTEPMGSDNWYFEYNPPPLNNTPTGSDPFNDPNYHTNNNGGMGMFSTWGDYAYKPMNGWVKLELEIRFDRTASGYVKAWENGKQVFNNSGVTDATSGSQRTVTVGGYTMPRSSNQWMYFADVYIDTARQRIVLANNPNINNATIKEVQIPSAWNDTSISLSSNLGKFTSGQTAYLFVYDSTGTPNTTGYPVTIGGGGGGDTTPPTSPTNLVANATSQSSITVSWTAATDNIGVAGYQVEHCSPSGCSTFTQVGTPTSSPFIDSGLTANAFYNYHVRAVDAAGNTSGWSNVVGATTQAASQTPTISLSANPTSITSGQSSTLTWSSTNATSCTASGSWSGTKATSGTQSVSPATTSTYTLTCTGTGGATNQSATVTVGSGGSNVSMNECSTMQNGWIFCNDFDTNVTTDTQRRAQWDDYDGATDVNFPQDNGPSQNSSNHVAQFLIPQNASAGADLVKVFGSSYQKLYLRYYTKYATGFPFTMGNHGGGLTAGDRAHLATSGYRPGDPATPSGSDEWADFRVQYNKGSNPIPYAYSYNVGMYQDCPSSGSCFGDSYPCVYDSGQSYCTKAVDRPTATMPTITAGNWHCVEETVDMGTAGQSNGTFQLTWDGAYAGNLVNMHFRNNANNLLHNLYLSLYSGDATHALADQRLDNIVVSTQPIGCGNTSTPDTTPPTSPTNLAANATSESSITVSWDPATDNIGVTGYQVERCLGLSCSNFTQVGTTTSSPLTDSNLTASTGYSYHVRAVDAAGNTSDWSNVVGTTTQGTPTPTSCSTVTPTNFTTSTYTGYGAPYDVFVSNTPLISTTCTSSDTHTINATLGITGDTTRIVYTKGYYYDPGISDWTSFTGTCTGALNGDWCQGSVSATLTDTDISTASASDPAYLVGMTCSIQGGTWKCGCRDTTCSTFYWQVQGAGL